MPAAARRSPKRPGLKIVTRPGSAALYLRGTVAGSRIFESAGTTCPRLAEEARAAREAQLYRAAVHGEGPASMPFDQAVKSYLQIKPRSAATKVFLARLVAHWGPKTMCRDITQAVLDRACTALCRPGAKPATRLRNVITPARAVLTHAAGRGWCNPPVFEKVKGGRARTEWFTPAEAEAMLAACTGRLAHMRPVLAFLFCTGARVNEMASLEPPQLNLPHARATLLDTKNGGDRQVDLPPRLVAELATHLGRQHKPTRRALRLDAPERPAVFLDRARRPYRVTEDSRTTPYGGQIRASWAAVMKAAGITRTLTPHHARHSWASWHYALHKDLLRLKHEGAWSSTSQVERYAHLVPAGYEPAIRAFWGLAPVQAGRAAA